MKRYYILIFFLNLPISPLMSMEEEGISPLIVYPTTKNYRASAISDTLLFDPYVLLHSEGEEETNSFRESSPDSIAAVHAVFAVAPADFSTASIYLSSPEAGNSTAPTHQKEDDDEYVPKRKIQIKRKKRKKMDFYRKRPQILIPENDHSHFESLRGKSAEELWLLHQTTPLFGPLEKKRKFYEGKLFPCFERDCTNLHHHFARSFGGSIASHLASIRKGEMQHISCPHCNKKVNEEATALFYHWAISCKGRTEERAQIAKLQERIAAQDEDLRCDEDDADSIFDDYT